MVRLMDVHAPLNFIIVKDYLYRHGSTANVTLLAGTQGVLNAVFIVGILLLIVTYGFGSWTPRERSCELKSLIIGETKFFRARVALRRFCAA